MRKQFSLHLLTTTVVLTNSVHENEIPFDYDNEIPLNDSLSEERNAIRLTEERKDTIRFHRYHVIEYKDQIYYFDDHPLPRFDQHLCSIDRASFFAQELGEEEIHKYASHNLTEFYDSIIRYPNGTYANMLLWTCSKLESCCGTKCCVDKVLMAKFIGWGTIAIIVLIITLPCLICCCLLICSILYWLL